MALQPITKIVVCLLLFIRCLFDVRKNDNPNKPIFVFGIPRSGTTWLGRIFDSHPSTIYRHEPDEVESGKSIPFVFGEDELDSYVPKAIPYVRKWLWMNAALTTGYLPQFRKDYRGHVAQVARLGMVYAYRVLDAVTRSKTVGKKLQIPDLIKPGAPYRPVVKSVNSVTRLPLLAKSIDDCNIVFIVRHPCGVVSSGLRGVRIGKMSLPKAYPAWLRLRSARERNLNMTQISSMSPLEILAYQWMLFNEYVMSKLGDDPRFQLVSYEALCTDPFKMTEMIFANCGLKMHEQTRAFIDRCINYSGAAPRYFQTIRNPTKSMNRWKEELSAEQQQQIADTVAGSLPSKLFYE